MFSNEETYQSNINAVVHRWHLRFWIPKFTLLTEAGSDRRKTSEPASGKTVRTQTTIVSAETNAKTQQFQKEYDNAKELWRKLWKEKKYTEMIEALQQVDESVRDYDYYSSYLEPTYFMAKQYENAILAYEKALTMATDKKQKGHCYTGIGTMYSWLDKTEEKIKYYRLGAELGDETAIKRLKEMEGGK
jgi:tetratricopeptide (TPR) repeat protein